MAILSARETLGFLELGLKMEVKMAKKRDKTRGELAIELSRDGKGERRGLLERIAQAEVNRRLKIEVERRKNARV